MISNEVVGIAASSVLAVLLLALRHLFLSAGNRRKPKSTPVASLQSHNKKRSRQRTKHDVCANSPRCGPAASGVELPAGSVEANHSRRSLQTDENNQSIT